MDIVTQIAQQLEEPAEFLIRRVVRVIGEEAAAHFLQQILTLVANGYDEAERDSALLRRDSRPRTKGGTFFYLVRGGISPEQRQQLWPRRYRPRPQWAVTSPLYEELEPKEKGEATMFVELTGIPTGLKNRQGILSALFVVEPDEEEIPAGLPLPPSPSTYLVLMQPADYDLIAAEIRAGCALQVQGYCHIDGKSGMGMVLARRVAAVAVNNDSGIM